MAGYKLQGKTKDGNIVDIPLTATYDAAGNDIANQFEQINEKLAENENSIAVTVIQPNEWISLPDKIGVETYIFPQGINSNNAEGMNYLEPIPDTLRGKSFVLKINTVNSSDRIWEFTSSRNDCGKEVYVWGENDELGYKSLVDGKPNWQRVLMGNQFTGVIETVLVKEISDVTLQDVGTKQFIFIPSLYPIEEDVKALLPDDYDTSIQAVFTVTLTDASMCKLQDANNNMWIGTLCNNGNSSDTIDWKRIATIDENNLGENAIKSETVNYYKVKLEDTWEDIVGAIKEEYKNITYLFPVKFDKNKISGEGIDFYPLPDDFTDFDCGVTWSITFNRSFGGSAAYSSYSKTMTLTDHKGGFWFGSYNDKTDPHMSWIKLGENSGSEDGETIAISTIKRKDEESIVKTLRGGAGYSWYADFENQELNDVKRIDFELVLRYIPEGGSEPFLYYATESINIRDDDSSLNNSISFPMVPDYYTSVYPPVFANVNHCKGYSYISFYFCDSEGNAIRYDQGEAIVMAAFELFVEELKEISGGSKGTSVMINGKVQNNISFNSDPQKQITENAEDVAQLASVMENNKPIIIPDATTEGFSLPTEVGRVMYIYEQGTGAADILPYLRSLHIPEIYDISSTPFILEITTLVPSGIEGKKTQRIWELTTYNSYNRGKLKFIWNQRGDSREDSITNVSGGKPQSWDANGRPKWYKLVDLSANAYPSYSLPLTDADLELNVGERVDLIVSPSYYPKGIEKYGEIFPPDYDGVANAVFTHHSLPCAGSALYNFTTVDGKSWIGKDAPGGLSWERLSTSADVQRIEEKADEALSAVSTKTQIKTRKYELTRSSSSSAADAWFNCDDVDITNAISCEIEFTNADKNRGFKGTAGVPNFDGSSISTFDSVLGNFSGVEIGNNNNFTFFSTVSTCTTTLDGATHKALNVRLVKSHCKTLTNNDAEFKDYTGIDNARCILTVYYQE